jgi:hypothetical protein
MPNPRPRRLLRNSKACDFCHKRRIKCQNSPVNPGRCQNCTDFDVQCNYSRPSKRGANRNSSHTGAAVSRPQPPSVRQPVADSAPLSHADAGDPTGGTGITTPLIPHESGLDHSRFDQGEEASSTTQGGWAEPLRPAWQGFARTATPVVRRLLSVYHQTVYPM